MRHFGLFSFLMLLLASCSPQQENAAADEEEWAEIEAMADDAVSVPKTAANQEERVKNLGQVALGDFEPFFQRMEEMKSVERGSGETLLTGNNLTFDYDKRYILLNEGVVVEDDEGVLTSDRLVGRFSESNEVDFIEAEGHVNLGSSNRMAQADHAIYNHRSGFVKLQGKASASLDGNRLSGERIQLWVGDERKMICEPNALLEISSSEGLELKGVSGGSNLVTEIRSDKAVYEENRKMAELIGNVRIRDPRVAMNCDNVRLFLKDENEIDWIEALGGVIIQSDETRALAERATYHADEGKFTLEDSPMVKQGPNVMTGDRIMFWHESRRMVCEPNARALLHLPEDIKQKFLKDLDE